MLINKCIKKHRSLQKEVGESKKRLVDQTRIILEPKMSVKGFKWEIKFDIP